MIRTLTATLLALILLAASARAQTGAIVGVVRDETAGALPGATVQLLAADRMVAESVSGTDGGYRIDGIKPGPYSLRVSLVNFGRSTRDVNVTPDSLTRADVVVHLTFGAAVTVTGKSTFGNLADAERPTESLVGIAQSASQGAITGRQLDARSCVREKCWKRFRASSSASTAAREKPTSTTCADSISIPEPISPPPSPACP